MADNHIAHLRDRLMLQSSNDAPDPIGGFARDWQDVAEVWAAVAGAAPNLRFEAARQEVRVSHRIIIRWRPDVTAAMRFAGNAGVFAIHGAHDSDGRRAFLVCYCEQVLT